MGKLALNGMHPAVHGYAESFPRRNVSCRRLLSACQTSLNTRSSSGIASFSETAETFPTGDTARKPKSPMEP